MNFDSIIRETLIASAVAVTATRNDQAMAKIIRTVDEVMMAETTRDLSDAQCVLHGQVQQMRRMLAR